MKHNGHNYDDYLDDKDFIELAERMCKDFLEQKVSIEDFEESEFRENLVDYAEEAIRDFVADEAVDSLGYKYGELFGSGYYNVAEHLIEHIEKMFKGEA